MPRALGVIAVTLVGSGLLAAGYWAGRVSLEPPRVPSGEATSSTLRINEGEVGRTMSISVSASRDPGRELRAGMSGTVTEASAGGAVFSEGEVLLEIDLRPAVVVLGEVPSFRDMRMLDNGADVRQLQAFLVRSGANVVESGEFDAATEQAVRDWQGRMGVARTGIVSRADVVFVPVVPLRLDVLVEVGDQVDASTPVAREISDTLNFTSTLPNDPNIIVGAKVDVEFPSGTWSTSVTSIVSADPSSVVLAIGSDAGTDRCDPYCAEIEGAGPYTFTASLVIVPTTVGPVIPVGAIATNSVGRQTVTLADGEVRPISIRVAYGGLAVVSGVNVGDTIVLPVGA